MTCSSGHLPASYRSSRSFTVPQFKRKSRCRLRTRPSTSRGHRHPKRQARASRSPRTRPISQSRWRTRRLCGLHRCLEPAVEPGNYAGEQLGRALLAGGGTRRDENHNSARRISKCWAWHPCRKTALSSCRSKSTSRSRRAPKPPQQRWRPPTPLEVVVKRPWSNKEFPEVAQWLAANDRPLTMLMQASQRPHRYDPLLIKALAGPFRFAARHAAISRSCPPLIARAMLRLDEGLLGESWQDILACHRLARLAAEGPCLVDGLVGWRVEEMADRAIQPLLRRQRFCTSGAEDAARFRRAAAPAQKLWTRWTSANVLCFWIR